MFYPIILQFFSSVFVIVATQSQILKSQRGIYELIACFLQARYKMKGE